MLSVANLGPNVVVLKHFDFSYKWATVRKYWAQKVGHKRLQYLLKMLEIFRQMGMRSTSRTYIQKHTGNERSGL